MAGINYWGFIWSAKTIYSVHSPTVYSFADQVLEGQASTEFARILASEYPVAGLSFSTARTVWNYLLQIVKWSQSDYLVGTRHLDAVWIHAIQEYCLATNSHLCEPFKRMSYAVNESVEWSSVNIQHNTLIIITPEEVQDLLQALCRDEIHWEEMIVVIIYSTNKTPNKLWNQLCQVPHVQHVIDLYDIGVLIFRKDHQHPAHHVLVPSRIKWWDRTW